MRWAAAALTVAASLLGGCDLDASSLASFLGSPFGATSGTVSTLDEGAIERVMETAVGRFRAYNTLREVLPFAMIGGGDCSVVLDVEGESVIETDMACALGQGSTGSVAVRQDQLAASPVPVFRFSVSYGAVQSPELEVDGTEVLTETVDADGATVHELDLVQDGVALRYTFRSGLIDDETPVFDYTVSTANGDIGVRITNPTGPGAFATVILTGIDGALNCELRDTDWSLPPRGSCDNGVVFGLP